MDKQLSFGLVKRLPWGRADGQESVDLASQIRAGTSLPSVPPICLCKEQTDRRIYLDKGLLPFPPMDESLLDFGKANPDMRATGPDKFIPD